MKIAITADPFIPVPPQLYGGIERIIDLLITELHNLGHEVTLFAHKDSQANCELRHYNTDKRGVKSDISNLWLINKSLISQNFDVVHSFGRLAYLLPSMPLSISKLMSYQREPTLKQVKRAIKLSSKGSLAFTGCSDYISNKIKPYAPVFTVYNCVNTLLYKFNADVGSDAPLIFLGRIEYIKGVHTAIEIAIKTNRRLVIAGNVPSEANYYFETKVKPFLNNRISYVGPVNDIKKNELLGKALALLMPIHWDEPFGIVMIEAMACGTPVIGFDRGAVGEVVENAVNGYVVTNTKQAIDKVDCVANINRSTVRKITEERFSSRKIVKDYLSVYQRFDNGR